MRALPAALAELDPGFEAKGCPSEAIDTLERAHGRALPAWYRLYLETLGRSFGALRYYGDMDLRPESLVAWLTRIEQGSPRYLQVGLAAYDSEFHLFVDLEGPAGEDALGLEVVSFESPPGPEGIGQVQRMASSFSTYLLLAHATRLIEDMPAAGTLGAQDPAQAKLPQVAEQLRRAGTTPHPLSGAWDQLHVGAGSLALSSEFGGQLPVSVYLGSASHEQWWALASSVTQLGLKVGREPS